MLYNSAPWCGGVNRQIHTANVVLAKNNKQKNKQEDGKMYEYKTEVIKTEVKWFS